jgi:Recombinase
VESENAKPKKLLVDAMSTTLPMVVSQRANERWSFDFVADQLIDGRCMRILVVVDDCTRECLEAMKQKARRGELFLTVAVGYVKTDDDRIELIADRRVRDAIALVFSKFAELQTVRQVLVWMRREQIVLPAIVPGTGERPLEWKLPVYHTLHHMLTNPVYAGAYVFGRRGSRVTIEAGRKRVIRSLRRNWSDWEILIKDHHAGYITWVEFERNQRSRTMPTG